jgi:cytochrome b561
MHALGKTNGYPISMVTLHWLMLILIASAYALIELKSFAPRGSALRLNMALLHYLTGLIVLALVLVRLILRMRLAMTAIAPEPQLWQKITASVVHLLLYVMMIGLPAARLAGT